MRDIYFYKEVCFVSLTEVRSLSLIMFLVGSMGSIQQLHSLSFGNCGVHLRSTLTWSGSTR